MYSTPPPQVKAEPHPHFEANEYVFLRPTIFKAMCQNSLVTPSIDMFASARHHQLPSYFSTDPNDSNAEEYKAFNCLWNSDTMPCVKPLGIA